MKRYFKVLDGSGVGFGLDFTGMVLEFLHIHPTIPNYVCLKQPEKDVNCKPCAWNGIVYIDSSKLEEIEVEQTKTIELSVDKWETVLSLLRSKIHHLETIITQDQVWYEKDDPDPELQAELEEAQSLFEEIQKQVENE